MPAVITCTWKSARVGNKKTTTFRQSLRQTSQKQLTAMQGTMTMTDHGQARICSSARGLLFTETSFVYTIHTALYHCTLCIVPLYTVHCTVLQCTTVRYPYNPDFTRVLPVHYHSTNQSREAFFNVHFCSWFGDNLDCCVSYQQRKMAVKRLLTVVCVLLLVSTEVFAGALLQAVLSGIRGDPATT